MGVLVIVIGGSIAAVMMLAQGAPTPSPSSSLPAATAQPTASDGNGQALPPPPEGITYTDFAVDTEVVRSPTTSTAQSKLWFADGRWWAALFGPTTDRLGIFMLDPATQVWADTGTLIDERAIADTDMLWTGSHLYAVSGGSRPSENHAIRVRRFAYDAGTKRYTVEPDYPVTIRPVGASPPVIAVDSTDTAWVTYVADGKVWVHHSLDGPLFWSEPIALPVEEATVDAIDVASIVAFGPGRIGVAWTNQRSGIHFTFREDGTADDAWSPVETILPGPLPADQLHITTYPIDGGGTSVAAAVGTTLDQAVGGRSLDPLTLLATRRPDTTWPSFVTGLVRDRHTRPIVLVDATQRTIAVAATSPGSGGTVYYKRAPLDRIEFDTGVGVPLIVSTEDTTIDNVTSAKGPLAAETGLLVMASDRTSGRYLHGVVDLGAGAPTADPADPDRPTAPTPPPDGTRIMLMRDTFEAWPIGAAVPTAWYTRPEDPTGRLSIVQGPPTRALRVSAAGAGVRACHDMADIAGATLTVDMLARVSRVAREDATILSVRGSGGEAVSVRVTDKGVFGWFDGSRKVRSSARFRAGAWYRIIARVDQAKRTYDLRITTGGGRSVARARGLRWRMPAVRTVGSVCVETASTPPAQAIDIGEVRVSLDVTR